MKNTIFYGSIPEIFGYGIEVIGESEEACIKAMKDTWRKTNYPKSMSFKKACDYFGMNVIEVEIGKAYFGPLGNE
jgi:hypothetical protein